MAIYEFEGPDGKTYEFEGPEGAVAKALPSAAKRFPSEAIRLAKDPQVQANAIRFGLPIAAGVATGGAGALPALGAASVVGGGAEGLAQIRERAAGLPSAPKTSMEAAKKIGKEGVVNAAFEGLGRGLGWAGKKVGEFAKRWAAGRGAAQSAGASADELARVYGLAPETVEPGYFKQRIDTFTSDLPTKVKSGFETRGAKLDTALKAEGKTAVMRTTELSKGVEDALAKLSAVKTPDAEQAARAVKDLVADLEARTAVDPLTRTGGDITAADIVKFESDMWELTKRGGKDVKNATGQLRLALDEKLSALKKITAARKEYKMYRQAADVLEDFMGVTPKSTPAELATKVDATANNFLAMPEPVKDAIRKALDTVDPSGSMVERLEKLAAAGGGEGRLSASQPLLPSMGVGNVGWSVANPGPASTAIGATAALRGAKSSPIVRSLFRMTSAPLTQRVLLPGLAQAGQVGRALRAISNGKEKK